MKMPLCDFGRTVKFRLIELGQTQKWLVEEVSSRTGLYFDTFYLHKVLTGKSENPKIIDAIKDALMLQKEEP